MRLVRSLTPICSDFPVFFRFVPICDPGSDFFRFVFRTNQGNPFLPTPLAGNPFLPTPFASPRLVFGLWGVRCFCSFCLTCKLRLAGLPYEGFLVSCLTARGYLHGPSQVCSPFTMAPALQISSLHVGSRRGSPDSCSISQIASCTLRWPRMRMSASN